jgi:uncharacterized protein YndB with AHSA1/START domain
VATIQKTIEIEAWPLQVWRTLTETPRIRRWAGAFVDDADLEADFRPGGRILWKGPDGKPMMQGRVAACEPERRLVLEYPPDELDEPSQGLFSETYELSRTPDGTQLTILCEPLSEEDCEMLAPLWDRALNRIREISEAAGDLFGRLDEAPGPEARA